MICGARWSGIGCCEHGRLMRVTARALLVGPIGARNEYRVNASSISNAATIQQAAGDD
jgi:hypothetical protein